MPMSNTTERNFGVYDPLKDEGVPTEPLSAHDLSAGKPLEEAVEHALGLKPKLKAVPTMPIPAFALGMEELFDQLWIKTQRRLASQNEEEDRVFDEEAEIRHQSIQSLLVTSWAADEGGSTVSIGLASRAAANCRGDVCLVDADDHQHDLSKMFGAEIKPGLRQLLRDEAKIDDTVLRLGKSNLYLLPTGSGSAIDSISVESRLQTILAELEERFRYVIFDAPCLKHGVEGYKWGRFIVNAILVVRAGSARRQTVSHAITSMRSHGMRVIGTILNRRVDLIPNWLYPYL